MQNKIGEKEFEESLSENVALRQFTTIGIGGPARYFAEVATVQALAAGLAWARRQGIPTFVLGGGSNIVVADTGFSGLVLRNGIKGVEASASDGEVTLTAGAGEDWDSLVSTCVAQNWAGFECLSGIPGWVGAAPIQNVGAYGQEVSETMVSLRALEAESGKVFELSNAQCEFGYRTSRFKTRDRDRFIITGVKFRLAAGGKPAVRYMDLQLHLVGAGIKSPSLTQVREAVLAIRRSKAMVIDPADPDSRSVGSFFVNPVVTSEEFEKIKAHARSRGQNCDHMPTFAAGGGRVKLPAAWLIEQAGFERGYVYGNVGISRKHALAIVNRGGGAAREVLELAGRIKSRVRNIFGVTLTPEPIFIGF